MTPSLLPAYDRILDQLRSNGNKVRQTRSGQALAQCPAHEDRTASLSVTGIEGQVLVHCHAGCDTHDVLAALKMTMGDLFDNRSETVYRYDDGRRVRRWYTEDGTKQFSQFGTKNPTSVLYRLDKIQAAENGTPIYLVEGEKDVHAIESLGGIATTSPQGAQSFHKVDPTPLHGRNVLAVVDRDDKGKEWARQVRDKLDGKAKSVKFVQAKAGKDAADHIAADYSLAEFEPLELEEVRRRKIRLTPLSAIKPRPVRWAWADRIPAGELTLTPGRGGVGKSTFHVWAIAHLTRGILPGVHFGTPKPCIIAAAEDSWERTIIPRLIAAGANMTLVYRVDVITDTNEQVSISLPRDVDGLIGEINRIHAALLSVDPVMSVLSNKLDSHKDHEVRLGLEPIGRLADRTGCAVLGNAHFNKSAGSDPLSLIMGSAAFGNVARAALGFARDTEAEDGSCVISQAKNNLGRLDLPSLRYRIDPATIDTEEGPAEAGRLVMLGESDRSVSDILRDRNTDDDERSERDEAAAWLIDFLTNEGGSAKAGDAIKAAAGHGIAKATLGRARTRVGVRSAKQGMTGGWVWTLEELTEGTEELKNQRVSPSGSSMSSSDTELACTVCGFPLHAFLIADGVTTHPNCDETA